MTKQMSVADMRAEIADYKKKHCPPIPAKKSDLVKVCEQLGLRTTKGDTKTYRRFGMPIPSNLQPKQLYTKKELIAKIIQRNGRDPAFYKSWSQADLKEYYAGMR
jgi:hypothetical protein